jgi:hypothetical protein
MLSAIFEVLFELIVELLFWAVGVRWILLAVARFAAVIMAAIGQFAISALFVVLSALLVKWAWSKEKPDSVA